MKIVAKSVKGKEYLYTASTAHKVPNTSAKVICDVLNKANYNLKEGETWFVHDVSPYDRAYEYASFQSFARRNGKIVRVA